MTKPRDSQEQASAGNAPGPRLLVLVTGLSGAGKSTALAALEDIGFTVVDNLPLAMLDGFVGLGGRDSEGRGDRPVALGIDVRARDFDTAAMEAAARRILARSDIDARLIFLDCADDILVQRYSETRRRHPLLARERPVLDGVRLERQMIAPLVFDVRFLRNPHYVERLRPTTGLRIRRSGDSSTPRTRRSIPCAGGCRTASGRTAAGGSCRSSSRVSATVSTRSAPAAGD